MICYDHGFLVGIGDLENDSNSIALSNGIIEKCGNFYMVWKFYSLSYYINEITKKKQALAL